MRYSGQLISTLLHDRSPWRILFAKCVKNCQFSSSGRTSNHRRKASSFTRPSHQVPDYPARTRFAPSPTGSLHLGSIRTAVFNYLLAKRTNGKFLLRIEDTDQKRTIPGAEEQLCNDLSWVGLQWDEGPAVGGPYGPYRQSERTAIYQDHAAKIVKSKLAYRCFCSPDRIQTLHRSRHEKGLPLGYDRKCALISPDESDELAERGSSHVVRLRAPEKYPQWNDLVYGNAGKAGSQRRISLADDPVYDDPVIIKSDGHPTYHLANVVDDHLMKITHVIRGSEWMSSTPTHLALYEAFGWEPPIFGHVPLLVDQNNQKLSKRKSDTDISSFRDSRSIFPDALINFAVLLGWSHQQKSDLLPLHRLKEIFDLKFTKGNTIVSLGKLQFLQQQYARQYIAEGGEEFRRMVGMVCRALSNLYDENEIPSVLGNRALEDVVGLVLRADSKSYTTPVAFAHRVSSILKPPRQDRPYKMVGDNYSLSTIKVAAASFLLVPSQMWSATVHRANFDAMKPPSVGNGAERERTAEEMKAWKGEVCHFLRWSLMGGASGPPLPDVMEILGREVCHERINSAINNTSEQEETGQSQNSDVLPLATAA